MTLTARDRLVRKQVAQEPRRGGRRTGDDAEGAHRPSGLLETRGELQSRLMEEIGKQGGLGQRREDVEEFVSGFVDRVLEGERITLNSDERERLAQELTEEAVGLGPLSSLMSDPAVTDILVNGPDRVYVERFGILEKTTVRFRDDDHILRVIERIAASVGRRIDHASPMVDLRLQDGSRVNATIPPASIDWPTMSIRRFGRRRLRRDDLVQLGMMSQEVRQFLEHAVRGRMNVLLSGGTGAGKSTLLGALAEAIPGHERIVTIEDVAELILDQEHVVRLETRPPNIEGRGHITMRDLLVNALRMRPTRLIVGEVRGGEALDLLQAMNTGHDGGLSTVHANSPRDALNRLETLVLMAGIDLPSRAIREQIASAIQIVVHVKRFEDGVRRVDSIAETSGLEGNTPRMQEIFKFERKGTSGRRIVGELAATGTVPRVVEALRAVGEEVPLSIFRRAGGSDVFTLFVVVALVVMSAGGVALLHSQRRGVALRRVEDAGLVAAGRAEEAERPPIRPLVVRHRGIAVMAGASVGLFLGLVLRWPAGLAGAFSCIGAAIAWIVEDQWAQRRETKLDEQLADVIDLMVSALRSGTSLVDALEIATEETVEPLRPALDEIVARLRLGDSPDAVFHDFGEEVGAEAAQILAFNLTVHWRVGGSLAPALATVSQSARHRIEFTRRVRSQATEGRASVIGMLGITYMLTLLLWRAYPDRFETFLSSDIGVALCAAAITLQAVGLVWMAMLTRMKP